MTSHPNYTVGDQIVFERPGSPCGPIQGEVVAVSPSPAVNGDGFTITWREWIGTGPTSRLALAEYVHGENHPNIHHY